MAEHSHFCPWCYRTVPCAMDCWIEPALSQERATGFPWLCDECEALLLARRAACSACAGCGQVADTKSQEPWSYWLALPPGADVAVRMGVVRPIPCPACVGYDDAGGGPGG